jgi:hypothetical protein
LRRLTVCLLAAVTTGLIAATAVASTGPGPSTSKALVLHSHDHAFYGCTAEEPPSHFGPFGVFNITLEGPRTPTSSDAFPGVHGYMALKSQPNCIDGRTINLVRATEGREEVYDSLKTGSYHANGAQFEGPAEYPAGAYKIVTQRVVLKDRVVRLKEYKAYYENGATGKYPPNFRAKSSVNR